MNTILFIYYNFEGEISWWVQGDTSLNSVGIETLALKAKNKKVVVIVPSEKVLNFPCDIKAKSRAQLLAAVPFALEEQLLSPVETLHFSLSSLSDENIKCWVIENALMDKLKDKLQELKIKPDVVLPEYALLDRTQQKLALLHFGDRTVLVNDSEAISVSEDVLRVLLEDKVIRSEDLPLSCSVFGEQTTLLEVEGINYKQSLGNKSALLDLTCQISLPVSINLLQAQYKTSTKLVEKIKPWALTGALILVLFGLLTGGLWLENNSLENQVKQLSQNIDKVYTDTFPGARVVSAKAQMQQKLASIGGNQEPGVFSSLVSKSGAVLFNKVAINTLAYSSGALRVEVQAEKIELLESLVKEIKQEGLMAQLESVNSQKDQVKAKIKITLKEPK